MRASPSALALVTIFLLFPMASGAAAAGAPLAVVQQDTLHSTSAQSGTAPDTIDRSKPVTGGEIKCVNGKAMGYACHNVDLVAFLPYTALGAEESFGGDLPLRFLGMWGWTDSTTGREFVVMGRVGGTSFIEVTDPANPKYLGDLPRPPGTGLTDNRDMKVYKNHAFIIAWATGPSGVQVFDLTQLLDVKNGPVVFQETARYDGVGSIHTIALNEQTGYAYAAYSDACGGLLMLDVRMPAKPTFAGCWVDSVVGPVHETACFVYHGPDQRYRGRELCFSAHEGRGISIADVTDKQRPKTISTAAYPNISYAHQGWLSEDHRYFVIDDEMDEMNGLASKTRTIVVDVGKLDDPVLATEFFGATGATDHNLYIRGQYAYQGIYKGGFRVLDVADPKNLKIAGYFDTFPDGEEAGIAGAHDLFAYFKQDGLVAINDIVHGLFLLRFRR